MSPTAVILADLPALKAGGDLPPGPVWYLGSRYQDLLALQELAGPERRVEACGERLNQLFDAYRDDFINLDRHLASGRFRALWDLSDLAERNPFTSDFMAGCCRALILLDLLESGKAGMVVVDGPALVHPLAEIARRAGHAVTVQASAQHPLRGAIRNIVLRRLSQGWRWWKGLRQARQARAPQPVRWDRLKQADTLLISWCLGKSFGGTDGAQPDAYYGGFPAFLKQAGRQLGWLGNSADWMRGVPEMMATAASAADPVAMVQDLWRPWDLLRALLASLAFPLAVRRHFSLGGRDLTPLLKKAVADELGSTRLSFALLYGFGVERLAERGIAPKMLIHPYERQPWEMALRRAVRRWLPQTELVGFMHAPVAQRYISFLPSREELRRGLGPDRLLVIGEHYRQGFAASGIAIEAIAVAGAFRFAGAFGATVMRQQQERPAVLCPCPIEFDEALELVRKTAQALIELPQASLLVNFHPAADRSFRAALETEMQNLLPPERVEFSDQPASALLTRVACVVYNASGVVFEAARAGVPSIFIGSEVALDLDKLPGGAAPPRKAEELAALLTKLLNDEGYRQALAEDNARRAAAAFAPPVTSLAGLLD